MTVLGVVRDQFAREVGRRSVWQLAVVAAAVVAGAAAVRMPLLAVATIALVVIVVVAWSAPEYALAAGSLMTMVSPDFGPALLLGSVALVIGGLSGVGRLTVDPAGPSAWIPLVPAGIALSWIALRLIIESGDAYVRPLAACAGAVCLAYATVVRERDWSRAFALGALVFVLATALLGQTDPTGLRFEGLSGNPNRMVYGALICTVVLISQLNGRRSKLWTLACLVGSVVSAFLILASGSDQGVVGLAAILVSFLILLTRRGLGPLVAIGAGLAFVALIVLALGAGQSLILDPDVRTLSGRTLTYRAGWQEFLQDPIFGTGQLRVTQNTIVERSTHNSIIGIAAATGIVGVLAWLTALLVLGVRSFRQLRAGYFASAIGLVVCLSQLVQSIELVPLTWAALALVTTVKKQEELDAAD